MLSVMQHYPNPKQLRERSFKEGVSVVDRELQEAMVKSAQIKIEKNLDKLEETGNLDTTGYGYRWIADNVEFLASKLISKPTTEIVKAFLNFPEKLKYEGEVVSTSGYLNDLKKYRAMGIKTAKIKDEFKEREQVKINEFVFGSYGVRDRARTASYLILSIILREVMCVKSKREIEKEEASLLRKSLRDIGSGKSKNSYSNISGKIMDEVIDRLIYFNQKELAEIMKVPTVKEIKSNKKFITAKGTANSKGKALLKILNVKSIKSFAEAGIIGEGRALLDLVDSSIPDIVLSQGNITMTEESMEELNDCRDMLIERSCEARPVLEKPITDGYTTSYREYPLKKRLMNTNALDGIELSEIDIKAVQRIQSTPFRIHTQYLKAIKKCMEAGLHIKDKLNVEVPKMLEKPSHFPKFKRGGDKKAFDKLNEKWFKDEKNLADYREWSKKRDKRLKDISKAISINDMNRRTIEIAQWYADYGGVFYLPVYFDYRTRTYYVPTIMNPQASKLSKALFVSAHAEEITDEGMDYWLVNFANSMDKVEDRYGLKYGGDKSPWDVALYSARNELSKGAEVASDPIDTFEYWSKQDDPFGYLAQSFECAGVLEEGADFRSKIFIHLDGSNNGAQHASAYLMDKSTAELVNMTYRSTGTSPADMYGEVANTYTDKLVDELLDKAFIEKNVVTRSSCKRIVMCMNYGLTEGGALNYAKEEIEKYTDKDLNNPFDQFHEEGRQGIYEFFRDGVWDAVAEVAPAILRTKNAMADLGKLVCEFGDGIVRWETFTGSKLAFTKYVEKSTKVKKTFKGKSLYFTIKEKLDKIDQKKVSNATAPNYTHGNDATHLRMVALAMPEKAPLMFIHDSFSTIAKYSPKLAHEARQQFIVMYKDRDPLMELMEYNLKDLCKKFGWNFRGLMAQDINDVKQGYKGQQARFLKILNQIKENITRTNDLDLDAVMDCIYFFR